MTQKKPLPCAHCPIACACAAGSKPRRTKLRSERRGLGDGVCIEPGGGMEDDPTRSDGVEHAIDDGAVSACEDAAVEVTAGLVLEMGGDGVTIAIAGEREPVLSASARCGTAGCAPAAAARPGSVVRPCAPFCTMAAPGARCSWRAGHRGAYVVRRAIARRG